MKIKSFVSNLGEKYDFRLKIIKKGIFWIMLDEDAFFMSKMFNLKITVLDKNTIKVGFPDGSKDKWLNIFKEKKIGYYVFEKVDKEFVDVDNYKGDKYTKIFLFNLEDYTLTKDRILGLKRIGIEEKTENNFLLKDKIEDVYIIVMDLLLKLPKKERYFIRQKIEILFLDIFESLYLYMYNLGDRKGHIEIIFNKALVLREFLRLLYKMGRIQNDNVYLDLGNRWIEVLKISKGVKSKY